MMLIIIGNVHRDFDVDSSLGCCGYGQGHDDMISGSWSSS